MSDEELGCPLPIGRYDRIVLAHGGGGRAMHRLIEDVFVRALGGPDLDTARDGATVDLAGPLVISTDAFTVRPLFFPGGDIGRLAVCGTVNDVAMGGGDPKHLTAAFVLEEGLEVATLERILRSMKEAAAEAQVSFVTGDTKVVERGKGDGVYVTTTGVGPRLAAAPIGPAAIQPGDAILVSGPVGDHGMAVLSVREGLAYETPLESDVAPVAATVRALFDAGIAVRCLRDPTRGGLASALCELASAAALAFHVDERAIPIRPTVADGCELLGLDPLHMACEGRFVAVVAAEQAEAALATLRREGCAEAAKLGTVTGGASGRVILRSAVGGERVLDMLAASPLPRIC